MSKKQFLALVKACLIAALLFIFPFKAKLTDETCAAENYQWSAAVYGELSGDLIVNKTENRFSFQWSNPVAEGITIKPEMKNFFEQGWEIEGAALRVSMAIKHLPQDQRVIALELMRKLSKPLVAMNWGARENHSKLDSAKQGRIEMNDYHFSRFKRCLISKISFYEQSGLNYQKPEKSAEIVYSNTFFSFGNTLKLKSEVTLPSLMESLTNNAFSEAMLSPQKEREYEVIILGNDVEKQKQIFATLQTNRSPSALRLLLKGLSVEQVRPQAENALKLRVENGIYEEELWLSILQELHPKSKYLKFAVEMGKSYILNFPGAFRDSKLDVYSRYFW